MSSDAHIPIGDFLDLEIVIRARPEEGGYPAYIKLGDGSEFGLGVLDAGILPWVSSGDLAADGQRLFNLLLADHELRRGWDVACGRSSQRRLRLRIDPAAAELHTVPWELLWEDEAMLSAAASTPFSRYLPVDKPWGRPLLEGPIRILAVISSLEDLEGRGLLRLDVEKEKDFLRQALAEIESAELHFLELPATLERIEQELRQGYHVLYYLGHGAYNAEKQQAGLYLQDALGYAEIVTDERIAQMLARQDALPQLVFLAACQSAARSTFDAFRGLAPRLVRIGVPAVVAMQDNVALATARKLSQVFYQRLADHGLVDLALNEARSTLLTQGRPDAAVPALFMRLKEGYLWSKENALETESAQLSNDRLLTFGLGDSKKATFGKGEFVDDLGFRTSVSEPWSPALRYVIFAALPLDTATMPGRQVLQTARNLFVQERWYTTTGHGPIPPRYWSPQIFPISKLRRRAVGQEAFFWEERDRDSSGLVISRLAVTNQAEVVFSSANLLVRITQTALPVFCIGPILARCWMFSALVAELCQSIDYKGRTHLIIGMVQTMGSHLGCFAKGWPEPYEAQYGWSVGENHDWCCHSPNLRFGLTVDLMKMQPKELPGFIEEFAEEISLAYNHDTPRCFDDTGTIPARYFEQ